MKISFTKEKGWAIDVTIAGRRVRESGFARKKDAEEFYAELKVQSKRGKFGLERDRARVLISDLVKEHGAEIERTRARGPQMRTILEAFLQSLPAGLFLDELSTIHFREWIRDLKRRGLGRGPLSNDSCNRYLAEISGMLNAAPELFSELGESWRPPRIPWQKATKRGRERVISAEEKAILLEHLRFPGVRKDGQRLRAADVAARRDVADCFELALLTGMRGGEVRCLEWSEVDLATGEIRLPSHKTKTREPRVVLLNRRAVEILTRRKSGTSNSRRKPAKVSKLRSNWIFPNPAGDGPRPNISAVIRPLALRLGLRYGQNISDGFTPHSTRHTATTEMLRRGADLKTVQDVLGHSDAVMSLRYAHSTTESRRSAVESLLDEKA
jgi:integrase